MTQRLGHFFGTVQTQRRAAGVERSGGEFAELAVLFMIKLIAVLIR